MAIAGTTLLEDTDLVDARFDQAEAIIGLITFVVTSKNNDSVVGSSTLENACSAVSDLLRQGREAFSRIDAARQQSRPKAR